MAPADDDPLDDPTMARMLRRYAAQLRNAQVSALPSPERRAALQAELDAVDAAPGRVGLGAHARPWWLAAAAAAALLIVAVAIALRSAAEPPPFLAASVAQAEPVRGAPRSSAFTVDVEGREPGLVRIYAFTRDGRRHALPLQDDNLVAAVTRRTHFGEFDLPDVWRLVVVFARQRESLQALDAQWPSRLPDTAEAERLHVLDRLVESSHAVGIAAALLTVP